MWTNRGVIFADHHAQLPTVEPRGTKLRIYYSTKVDNKSQIRFIDVKADDPSQVVFKSDPILLPGQRGCFDDSGVMPGSIVGGYGMREEPQRWLFYTGWNTDKGQVPYGHGIGMLWTDAKDKPFSRVSNGPLMDRSYFNPFLVNSPWVVNVGREYGMYYSRGTGWDGDFPTYVIAYANSRDGIRWRPHTLRVLGNPGEACSRACVFEERIYFAYKTKDTPYRLCVTHNDFVLANKMRVDLNFTRTDADSEMQCYPCLHRHGKRVYMFYNGNGYGATGILWAERGVK